MIDFKSGSFSGRFLRALAWRAGLFLLVAAGVGSVMNTVCGSLEKETAPAGFGRGMIQGALMPMTWPALAAGRDVTIYSINNRGVSYKLGYTAGVNLCGAVFFGLVFRRLSRLRAWARHGGHRAGEPASGG